MGKYQDIENAIYRINPAAFQELADAYLSKLHPDWVLKTRPGSHIGKQKTIKGTPDSAFETQSGQLILVQHSTNESHIVQKLEEDVDKCFDVSRTGIPEEKVDKVVLCTNFRMKPSDLLELQQYNSKVELYTLDKIALDIYLNYHDLARKFLGIKYEGNRLIEINEFIQAYDNSANKLATPLSIPFRYRETELNDIVKALKETDIIILHGQPGTGKTKLAVETCKHLASRMKCFALDHNNNSLDTELDDLKADPSDIIIFVDDIDRVSIELLNSLLTVYLGKRPPARKLIFTVRAYALDIIVKSVKEYNYKCISVGTFSDEQIKGIISSKPFYIRNSAFYTPILDLAEGNPRLAIMAARLAAEKKTLNSLHDVSGLLESYYSRIETDSPFLTEPLYVKLLGLLGFFHSINLNHNHLLCDISTAFGIDIVAFKEACTKLHHSELINISDDVVSISEQNLGRYYFYKAFLVDCYLSFDTLLEKFFASHFYRFKDVMVPITNKFGYSKIKTCIEHSLNLFAGKVPESSKRDFYETFYYFIPESTLAYVMSHLDGLDDINNVNYQVDYNQNDYAIFQHNDMQLLGALCKTHTSFIASALEIMAEIVRKKPEEMPRLIYTLQDAFSPKIEDTRCGYYRQKQLLAYFRPRLLSKDAIVTTTFQEVAKMMLQFSFQNTENGRNNSFTIYTVVLGLNESIQSIRSETWDLIDYLPDDSVNNVLSGYRGIVRDISTDVVLFDCPYVNQTVERHLYPDSFEHCLTVHKLKSWYGRLKIQNTSFEELSKHYTNAAFNMFLVLNAGKDYDEYKKWEHRVRTAFPITNQSDEETFIANYKTIRSGIQRCDNSIFNEALDFVVDETMCHSFTRGLSLMAGLMPYDYCPVLPFRKHLDSNYKSSKIWTAIDSGNVGTKLNYFAYLPQELVTKLSGQRFFDTVRGMPSRFCLSCNRYPTILQKIPILTEQILHYVVDSGRPILDDDWIEYSLSVAQPIELVEDCYLVCRKRHNYDFRGDAIKSLLLEDKSFLLKYLRSFASDEELPSLGFLWSLEDNEMMYEAFDYLIENNWDIFDGIYEQLFDSIPDKYKSFAESFLLSYVKKNYASPDKMNAVIGVVVSKMPNMKRAVVGAFLNETTDLSLFESINWTKSDSVLYNGNVNPGEVKADRLRQLLEDVNSSGLGVRLIPIKALIQRQISQCKETINYFRKRGLNHL